MTQAEFFRAVLPPVGMFATMKAKAKKGTLDDDINRNSNKNINSNKRNLKGKTNGNSNGHKNSNASTRTHHPSNNSMSAQGLSQTKPRRKHRRGEKPIHDLKRSATRAIHLRQPPPEVIYIETEPEVVDLETPSPRSSPLPASIIEPLQTAEQGVASSSTSNKSASPIQSHRNPTSAGGALQLHLRIEASAASSISEGSISGPNSLIPESSSASSVPASMTGSIQITMEEVEELRGLILNIGEDCCKIALGTNRWIKRNTNHAAQADPGSPVSAKRLLQAAYDLPDVLDKIMPKIQSAMEDLDEKHKQIKADRSILQLDRANRKDETAKLEAQQGDLQNQISTLLRRREGLKAKYGELKEELQNEVVSEQIVS